jgi:hypothetical protein
MESGHFGRGAEWQTDEVILGLQMAPKALKVIFDMELGKP